MKTHLILSIAAALALCSCGDKESTPAPAQQEAPAAHPLASVLGEVPDKENAIEVADARALPPGSPVTVHARLLGAANVFAERQAMLILADPLHVKPNYDKPKPYEACCIPAEIKASNTIPAQAVDAEGLPLPHSLKGLGGLKELDYVAVKGVIAPDSTPEAPIINISVIEKITPWLVGDDPGTWSPYPIEE